MQKLLLLLVVFSNAAGYAQPLSSVLKSAEKEAQAGHFLASAEWWERAGRLKSTNTPYLHQAAEAYARVREYVRAADCYKAVLDDPRFPLAPMRYARALKQQGRFEEAEQAFEAFAQSYQGAYKSVVLDVAENEILL